MQPFGGHRDIAENGAAIIAQRLIVVAGNEDDALAVAGAAQQLLNHGILCRAPVDTAAHGPEIDDVADQEDLFGCVFAQKIEKPFGLACPGTEVDVGEENGADLDHGTTLMGADEDLMTAVLPDDYTAVADVTSRSASVRPERFTCRRSPSMPSARQDDAAILAAHADQHFGIRLQAIAQRDDALAIQQQAVCCQHPQNKKGRYGCRPFLWPDS